MSYEPDRRRRKKTARETAEAFKCHPRTVQRHIAETRKDYEARMANRREAAGKMWASGSSWADISAAVGGSEMAARSLVRRYQLDHAELFPRHTHYASDDGSRVHPQLHPYEAESLMGQGFAMGADSAPRKMAKTG